MIRRGPGAPRWAIAGHVGAALLTAAGRRLPDSLQGEGHRVVTGADGFAALLVFGGSFGAGEDLSAELAMYGHVYLLDFNHQAPSIQEFRPDRMKYLKGNPIDFLQERGITLPGIAPPSSPLITAGLVEGISAGEARRTFPDVDARFAEHPRGVLVSGDSASNIALELSVRRRLRAFALSFSPQDGVFSCVIKEPDGLEARFTSSPDDQVTDSILGETTMDGILRVLQIPREYLQRSQ